MGHAARIYLPYTIVIPCSENLNWLVCGRAHTLAAMNDQASIATQAGTLVPTMPRRARIEVVRAWEPPPEKVSLIDSLSAGAFLIVYLAAYLAAGYFGVTVMEWAWMRIFG